MLVELHWLPVEYRIQYKILLFAFKGIHNLAPKYICDMFSAYSAEYRSRSCSIVHEITFVNGNVVEPIEHSEVIYLRVPKFKTFSKRSITVAGPRLWNQLPISLRLVKDYDAFKSQLKTYMFRLAHCV